MTDFLWHKVSEKEKEDIKKQAKQIMQNFSKKLDKVKSKVKEGSIERQESERKEGIEEAQEIDKEVMFENAPSKNKDFIIGEKKQWEL